MVTYKSKNGHIFEIQRDVHEVTSLRRPDDRWLFIDSHGHEHRWHPLGSYSPGRTYFVPTIDWVKTGTGYYEDGSEYDIGHYECKECGDKVDPAYTSDQYRQFIPGLAHHLIDGVEVTKEEFDRVVKEEMDAC